VGEAGAATAAVASASASVRKTANPWARRCASRAGLFAPASRPDTAAFRRDALINQTSMAKPPATKPTPPASHGHARGQRVASRLRPPRSGPSRWKCPRCPPFGGGAPELIQCAVDLSPKGRPITTSQRISGERRNTRARSRPALLNGKIRQGQNGGRSGAQKDECQYTQSQIHGTKSPRTAVSIHSHRLTLHCSDSGHTPSRFGCDISAAVQSGSQTKRPCMSPATLVYVPGRSRPRA
jgi:hypothetical protein